MQKFKEQVMSHLDIVFFLVIMTIKYVGYAVAVQAQYENGFITLLPDLASVAILASLVYFIKPKARGKVLLTLDIIFSLITISDIIYYRYYKDVLSVLTMQNGLLLASVKSSVMNLFRFKDLLFLLDVPFFVLLLILNKQKSKLPIAKRAIVAILGFTVSATINASCFAALAKQQHNLLTTMYNRIYIAKHLGNLNFHALDLYNTISNKIVRSIPVSTATISNIENNLNTSGEKEDAFNVKITKTSDKKNLIIIQVEALQQFIIGKSVDGEEITPNLNKFIDKSLYFDNYYYQVSLGNTSDAEFMTQNSLYPAANGAVCNIFFKNTYNSLPKALEAKGYDTFAMHGYKAEFWNRRAMNLAEGFNNFYAEEQLTKDEVVGMGISDKSFFNQAVTQIEKNKIPYYAFLTTLSSHFPYDDVKDYGDFNTGEYEGTLLGNYMKGIHYADAQIGMFLDKLKADGTLDNSIVIIYGDHYAIPMTESASLYKFLGMTNTSDLSWQLLQKVPMIMHFPGDKNSGINHSFSGEMDLYPTLATLYDLPHEGLFGRDLLNSKDGLVVFRNGSVTDGKYFYIASSNTWYDIASGKKINETSILASMKEKASTQLNLSDTIVNYNLFKTLNLK